MRKLESVNGECHKKHGTAILVTNVICIILGLCIVIPPLFALFFYYSASNKNQRSTSLQLYNERARYWNNVDIDAFRKQHFTAEMNGYSSQCVSIPTKFGYNWPIRDTCDCEYDPPEGCIDTDELYYKGTFNYYSTPQILSVYFNKTIIWSQEINFKRTRVYTNVELNCNPESSTECVKKCHSLEGEWSSNVCIVQEYLLGICLRVINQYGRYSIDNEHFQEVGCEPGSDFRWSPFRWSNSQMNPISIHIRSYYNPYISAADLTNGCSSINPYATDCFGVCARMKSFGTLEIAIIAFVFFFILMCLSCIAYNCISFYSYLPLRFHQSSNQNDHRYGVPLNAPLLEVPLTQM
ncbi:hypothetical protein WA158_006283 [Blastocystis sp. Blastoise]